MKIWKKRIACISMVFVLVIGMVPPLPVKASAATISAEASTEIMALIWSFLINGMLVGGADKVATADYDSEKNLFVTFMDALAHDILGMPEPPDLGTVTLSNGTYVDLVDFMSAYEDGTGALQIPDEETWRSWHVVEGGGGDSPEPEEPDFFSKVQQIMLGSGFLTEVVGFIGSLFDKEVEGLDPALFFSAENYGFISYDDMLTADGKYHILAEGTYTRRGNSIRYPDSYFQKTSFSGDCYPHTSLTGAVPVAVLYDSYIEFYWLRGGTLYTFYSYNRASTSVQVEHFSLETGEKKKEDTRSLWRIGAGENCTYSTNVPVYPSAAAAKAGENMLNGLVYDFPGLINSALEILAPFIGIGLDPAALPGLQHALSQGLGNLPVPGTDPAANTDDYKDVVGDIVTDYIGIMPVPQPQPDPEPDPEPEPEPEPDPDPDPEPDPNPDMDIDKYSVDLTGLFPFCIPFDYINLLKALSAEPEAPCFDVPFVVPAIGMEEHYSLDLSMFDDVMVVFRRLELVGFVIGLMFITYKMIKW